MVGSGSRDENTSGTGLEHEELLAALRTTLNGLPEQEQKLLALYYGGGLSHQEIGRHLYMPRRTVTHKIEESLNRLRARLSHAGFNSAVPWALAGGLSEAVCSGYDVPPGLHEKVLNQIALAGNATLDSFSRRATAVQAGGSAKRAGLVMTAGLLVAGFGWWLVLGAPPEEKAGPRAPGAVPAGVKAALKSEVRLLGAAERPAALGDPSQLTQTRQSVPESFERQVLTRGHEPARGSE